MVLPYKGITYDAIPGTHNQGINHMNRRLPCADFEMNYVECMEAYGMIRGRSRCLKYYEDLNECRGNFLKEARVKMMNIEKLKKIAKGEMSWEQRRSDPVPFDAYIIGTFWP